MIIVGGVLHLLIGIFHLFFEHLFQYDSEIKSLSFINQRIALFLNLILTVLLFGFGILSLLYSDEFTSTNLGRGVSILLSLVWMYRALLQIKYFSLKKRSSLLLFVLFLGTSMCYLGDLLI